MAATTTKELPPKPKSLMEMLEFIYKLYLTNGAVKQEICKKVKDVLTDYFELAELERMFNSWDGEISKVLLFGKALMDLLVVDAKSTYIAYGYDVEKSDEYGNYCFEILSDYMFGYFSHIYYMYFQCSSDCQSLKGGNWKLYLCYNTSHSLGKWLTDTSDQNVPDTTIFKRGFNEVQKRKLSWTHDGNKLSSDALEKCVDRANPEPLQKILAPMLFLGYWHDAKCAHALLFLKEFCETVKDESAYYTNENHLDQLKTACQNLPSLLDKLSLKLYPVCAGGRDTLYKYMLLGYSLQKYLDWLKINLPGLIATLNKMENECHQWYAKPMELGRTHGPFAYGLIFVNDTWEENLLDDLAGILDKLKLRIYEIHDIVVSLS